jgi:hypothetical protein
MYAACHDLQLMLDVAPAAALALLHACWNVPCRTQAALPAALLTSAHCCTSYVSSLLHFLRQLIAELMCAVSYAR